MTTLKAEKRSLDIKAKKLRRQGYVTGSVFGREMEQNMPIMMTQKDAEKLLRSNKKGSRLTLEVDGKQMNVLFKEYDYDALKRQINEIDFQALVAGEMVHSVAQVVLLNEDKVVGGVLTQELDEIQYRATPDALVEKIEVDVAGMKVGDTLRVADLAIAKNENVHVQTDLDAAVASVTAVHNSVPETEVTIAPAQKKEEQKDGAEK